MSIFIKENSQLLIIADDGTVRWKGQPLDGTVAKVVEIPNHEVALVLFDYYNWDKNRGLNLICIDSTSNILWQAVSNGNWLDDLIVDLQLKDKDFFVNTWNGNRYNLDVRTGSLILMGFTK